MNRLRVVGLILLGWLCLAATSATADTLTDRDVKNFIDSLAALQQMEGELTDLADEMERQMESNSGDPTMPNFGHMFSDAVSRIEDHPQFGKFSEIVEDSGFDDATDWGKTGDRVFQAWIALEMQDQGSEARQQMASAMAEIDNNPNMSAEQKAQMKEMMQGAISMMEQASKAPAADIEAIRPHIEELRRVTEEDGF